MDSLTYRSTTRYGIATTKFRHDELVTELIWNDENERENVRGTGEHGIAHRTISRREPSRKLPILENNALLYLSPVSVPSLIRLSLSPKARYIRIRARAVCARDSKKGSRAIRWQLFHI